MNHGWLLKSQGVWWYLKVMMKIGFGIIFGIGNEKMNKYFIVNQRLTYISTQLLLEWAGVKPKRVLYCSYYDAEEKLDEFLMEYVDLGDQVFLIGFQTEKCEEIKSVYNKYNYKLLESDNPEFKNVFVRVIEQMLPVYRKIGITEKQKYFIKCVSDLLNNNFSNKDAYFMGIIAYKVSPEVFHDFYSGGFNTSTKFNGEILKHIKLFKKQSQQLYEYDGYYFVMGEVRYLGDYIYKYHDKIDNISVVDLNNKRVYMKNLKSGGKDINILCKKYCKDIRGFEDFCSGEITEDFIKFSNKIKKVEL
jgi:hypothetical protein